jgi:hypothetical protein
MRFGITLMPILIRIIKIKIWDPDPDRFHMDPDPDRHQHDANPQHWLIEVSTNYLLLGTE